jgi:hypothetical protein
MEPTDPIEWDDLEPISSYPDLREIFETHRDAVATEPTLEAAVARLYRIRRREYDVGAPDQGVAFVFAYPLEREGLFEPVNAPPGANGYTTSLCARRRTPRRCDTCSERTSRSPGGSPSIAVSTIASSSTGSGRTTSR